MLDSPQKLPPSFDRAQCMERVESTLRILKLAHCAGSRLGSARRRGISGGEKKRTSIAVALVAMPQIMFLDEATSGV
jgi:ABC-type multidrug transport system ATPase subunit